MKITCHSCGAKYTVSDDKVQGKTVKMKCRKCGATIVVGGAAEAAQGVSPDGAQDEGAPPSLPPGSYLVNVADGDQRTMRTDEIIAAYHSGVVTADTYVWSDGMADWQALSENPALTQALASGANGGFEAATPTPSPALDTPYAPPAYTPPSAPAYAAPESNRPAARKDSGRRGNDLFGGSSGGGGMFGGDTQGVSAGTGKRDENSVLFSLNALAAGGGAPTKSTPGGTKEDSGLIDLRALAATSAPSTPSAVDFSASPLALPDTPGMFPLGAPPPVAAPVSAYAAPPEKPKSMALIAAIGGVVVLGLIVGVFFIVRGSGAPPAPTVVVMAPPTPEPVVTETPAAATATAEPVASAEATATASASAVAKAPVGGKWVKPTTGGTTPGKPTTTTPTKPATGGAKGACSHCGTDLMCAMKCSAGKK